MPLKDQSFAGYLGIALAEIPQPPLFPVRYQGKFGEVPSITLAVAEEMSETNSIERALIGENE